MPNPACSFATYMPKDCTPTTCKQTGEFCEKFFKNDVTSCVRAQSAAPSLLVAAAPSVRDVQVACCGSDDPHLVKGVWGDAAWLRDGACQQPTASKCKWNGSEAVLASGVEETQCVQRDRTDLDAGCPSHTSASTCAANKACTWNAHPEFDIEACRTTTSYEHGAPGMAFSS